MTLEEKQEQLIAQINAIGDCFDQYSYLIVRSHDLPPYPEKYRTEEHLVKGCQSKVWIHTAFPGGELRLDCDSDALILKGVLAILRDLTEGASARELAALEWSFLDRTGVGRHLYLRTQRRNAAGASNASSGCAGCPVGNQSAKKDKYKIMKHP